MEYLVGMTIAERRFIVDALAELLVGAAPTDLSENAAILLRCNVLDSLGCAIATLDGDTVRQVRDQIEAVGGTPRASLIGGGRTIVEKFHWLTRRQADTGLRTAILDTVADLDHTAVSALTELLTAVSPAPGPHRTEEHR
jgi:hypothetical protein